MTTITTVPSSKPMNTHGVGRILLGFVLGYAVLQGGLILLAGRLDQTVSSLIASAAMFAVLLGVEAWLFKRRPGPALLALGCGRPRWGALAVAVLLSAVLVAFIPAYALATATPITVRPDWAWILLGAVVLNGLAEEALFRGLAFGHLRQTGYSFVGAGVIALLLFAAAHLYLFVGNPPMVALLATLTAVAAAFPMALLFERSHHTLWACAILHTATHALRLVSAPEAQAMGFALAWIAAPLLVPLAVFAFRGSLLRQDQS